MHGPSRVKLLCGNDCHRGAQALARTGDRLAVQLSLRSVDERVRGEDRFERGGERLIAADDSARRYLVSAIAEISDDGGHRVARTPGRVLGVLANELPCRV